MGFITFSRKAVSPDSKHTIPDTATLSGSNGVELPGPMSGDAEQGFRVDGHQYSGVQRFSGEHVGVQLPGGPNEEGWNYGANMAGMAERIEVPASLADFGVEGGASGSPDADDVAGMRVIGTLGSNTAGVQASDIERVFHAVASNGGSGE